MPAASHDRRRLGRPALVAALVGVGGVFLVVLALVSFSLSLLFFASAVVVCGALVGFGLAIGALWRVEPTNASARLALVISTILLALVIWVFVELTTA